MSGHGMSLSQKLFFAVALLYWGAGMHFFMHNPGGSGFYLPFNMLGWAFASVLTGLGLWQITRTQQLVCSSSFGWLLAGFLVLCIPWLLTSDISRYEALPRMLGIAAGLLLLFSLRQWRWTQEQRLDLLYVLLLGIAIEAAFGLVQYYLLKPGNWIGYNLDVNRPYGIFQQVNVLASFLALGSVLSGYLMLNDTRCQLTNWRGVLASWVLMTGIWLQLLIVSRAGMIGSAFSVLIFLPLLWRAHRRQALCFAGVVVLGLVCGLVLRHEGGRTVEELANTHYRLIYWHHALQMFLEHPLFGWGYGRFESAFVNTYYAIPQTLSRVPTIEENLDHPHNEILYWLVEGGLVALLGLGLMVWGWLRMLARHAWSQRLALLALPVPLLFHAMVEYPFYHSVAHWIALMFLLWFTDEESGEGQIIPFAYWLLLRVLAIGIPLLTVPFMLTGMQGAYLITKFERGGMRAPQLLQDVINPLPWHARFMYDIMSLRLIYGLEQHKAADLQAYVEWARAFVEVNPRAVVYANCAIALDALNRPDEANGWRSTGQKLFPASTLWQAKVVSSSSTASQLHPTSAATQ